MSSSPQRDGTGSEARQGSASGNYRIVLELSLTSGDPVSGTVGLPGRSPTPFQGWIDLMSAINSLRAAGEQTG
jgi:hypothetical protein